VDWRKSGCSLGLVNHQAALGDAVRGALRAAGRLLEYHAATWAIAGTRGISADWRVAREDRFAKRALRMFIQKCGGENLKQAAENRRRDLLVYVALANLRKRSHLDTCP